jgi:transposase-like protein
VCNDPVPVETRLQLVLAVLAHEITVAEAARRHGVVDGVDQPLPEPVRRRR